MLSEIAGPLQIALSNRSNDTLTYGAINFDPKKGFKQFCPIPATGRNCNLGNCSDCVDDGQFSPVLEVDCNLGYFELTLITTPDGNGNAKGATWGVDPTCDFNGGVVCYV